MRARLTASHLRASAYCWLVRLLAWVVLRFRLLPSLCPHVVAPICANRFTSICTPARRPACPPACLYAGVRPSECKQCLAGAEGLEPPTFGFGDRRSAN